MIEEKELEEVKKFIQKEFGYTDEELESVEILDENQIIEYFEEYVKELIGENAWRQIGHYIDIEDMIHDDLMGGYLEKIEYKGKTYYFWPP